VHQALAILSSTPMVLPTDIANQIACNRCDVFPDLLHVLGRRIDGLRRDRDGFAIADPQLRSVQQTVVEVCQGCLSRRSSLQTS
jgi:hypothetical protein